MTELISNVILCMRDFQEKNCIKKQCVTNTQYLYDCIRMNTSSKVKAKPVIVVSIDDELHTFLCVGGHLVIVLDDDTIIEPSYDIFSLKNKSYFDNIKDFMNSFDNKSNCMNEELNKEFTFMLKKSVGHFLNFIKLAERINNGELVICDKDFYNNQADYIEKKL